MAIVFIIVSVVSIVLARQRVAMYIGSLIFVYYLFCSGFRKIAILGVVIPMLGGISYYLISSFDGLFTDQITQRFSNKDISTLFSSRIEQWLEAFDGFSQAPLFGLGIGSSGHVAYVSNPQHPIVTDGSYFKVLVEGGIVSFLLFMNILINSFLKGYKYRKKYYMEFPLLLFFICSLLGANIIDMPYIIIFMWYVIGRINTKNQYSYEQ
ncbi:MAG: O-antigen ligase family protein [Bacteroides sp.]|nr:O-antigen ligase family protein [Bacteroides sp.]